MSGPYRRFQDQRNRKARAKQRSARSRQQTRKSSEAIYRMLVHQEARKLGVHPTGLPTSLYAKLRRKAKRIAKENKQP